MITLDLLAWWVLSLGLVGFGVGWGMVWLAGKAVALVVRWAEQAL